VNGKTRQRRLIRDGQLQVAAKDWTCDSSSRWMLLFLTGTTKYVQAWQYHFLNGQDIDCSSYKTRRSSYFWSQKVKDQGHRVKKFKKSRRECRAAPSRSAVTTLNETALHGRRALCTLSSAQPPIFIIFGKNVAKEIGNMQSLTCLLLTVQRSYSWEPA